MTITRYSQEETTNFIANFLPSGKALISKFVIDTNLRKYLEAKSLEFKRLNDLYATFLEELDPRTTEIFLEEWESALSIPDECIPLASTDDERRSNIVLKLASLSVQTEEDLRNLAELFGFTIEFDSDNNFPYTFPATFPDPSEKCIGAFPYTFPMVFGPDGDDPYFYCIAGDFTTNPTKAETFQCLVRLLAPVGYKIVFTNT